MTWRQGWTLNVKSTNQYRKTNDQGFDYIKIISIHERYHIKLIGDSTKGGICNVIYICMGLRKLYAGQEATVRTEHGIADWFQIGKGVCQGCILSPCLFNLYAEYIMRNAGLDKARAGIKIAGRNIKPQICRWHHPDGRKQRTKEPLEESERRVKKLA